MNTETWHVYEMNDCDWWLARSLDEAKSSMLDEYGYKPEDASDIISDDAHQLSDADLDRLRFSLTESRKGPTISFREELANRIAAGPTPSLFASTEF